MTINKAFFLTVLLLCLGTLATAQHEEKQPLQKILVALEHRFAIVFTYADDNLAGISVIPPSQEFNLTETLQHLNESTGLLFQQLDRRFVAIIKAKGQSMSICGILTDADTGGAVAGANIWSGQSFSTSNDKGYFYIQETSADTLHVRFMGYRSLHIPVNEFGAHHCKSIRLQPEVTTLQSIFVSDFLTEGIDKRLDGALMIYAETLAMLPGLIEPDVLQTVQALPGIQSVNETVSDINVRGGTNDQNLVLWDGIRVYHSGHFFGLISAFNPYLTDKVMVIKNGSSAAAGDGVSSTIDIRTHDELSETFSAAAGINTLNGDFLAEVPVTEKASLQISGRRSVADIVRTPAYNQYFARAFRHSDVTNFPDGDTVERNQKFRFYDTSLKFIYNISAKDKIRVNFLHVKNAIDYGEHALVSNIPRSRTSGLEQANVGSGFFYSRLWNESVRTSAQLYVSGYKLGAVNFNLENDQRLIQENKVLDTGLKIDARIKLTNNVDLFSGYQFFETGITNLDETNNPAFRRLIKNVLRAHAAFSEVDFTFNDTNMRMGVRANHLPAFRKLIIEPRFAFNQNFLQNFNFELLGEMKNQTATQIIDLHSDFLGVEKRRWVLSDNDDIPIIRSKQISAGLYYKRNNFLISAEAYYKRVEGIITSSLGFQNQFQFTRTSGNYETIGIELLTSKKIRHFTTWLSYSNARNTLEFPQLIPAVFPGNFDIRHRGTFGCNLQKNNIEVSTGLNWHSGKPFTEPVEMNEIENNAINYGRPNSSRLQDYLRIDFSGKYKFTIGKDLRAEVGASIWNILNRKNIVDTYFHITGNKQLETVEQRALGATSNIIFRVKF